MAAPSSQVKKSRICAIDDCGQAVAKREWCIKHYERWKVHGDPLVTLRAANGTYSAGAAECGVDACGAAAVTCGMCGMHYQRFLKYGDPLVRRVRQPGVRKICTIKGCGRVVAGHGWCDKHYRRWKRTGNPELLIGPLEGKANPLWKGSYASGKAKHVRVYRLRGKADHCIWGCHDDFRYEWANLMGNYDDPYDFAPMCVTCHRRYDTSRLKTERAMNGGADGDVPELRAGVLV